MGILTAKSRAILDRMESPGSQSRSGMLWPVGVGRNRQDLDVLM